MENQRRGPDNDPPVKFAQNYNGYNLFTLFSFKIPNLTTAHMKNPVRGLLKKSFDPHFPSLFLLFSLLFRLFFPFITLFVPSHLRQAETA